MRSKKTIRNTIFSLLEEVIAVICGFILPAVILSSFGSKYNGITSSITQFLACAILLRAGIGGTTRAALYKPLANKDMDQVNKIIKATDIFMKKIGIIIGVSIIIFSFIYPLFVIDDFNYLFSCSLFLIIGISTFAESFFGITYLIVLQADQQLWISSLIKSLCYILNTVVAVALIKMNFSIHIVKLGSAIVFALYPIILQIYTRRKYNIDLNVETNNNLISQRWDAFWQQVATFVMANVDIIVLTIFTNVVVVSIYSVYNLVINGLKRFVQSFSNGLEAAFGNMIANNEKENLKNNLSLVEFIMYSLATFLYTVSFLVILQFIMIYTKNINDANYIQPFFAYILLIAQFFNTIRLPYQLVVQAAGHYKQTRNGAIIEPILNITLSIIFVVKFGIVGVAIGTLVSTIFRTIQYSYYMRKNIIPRNYLCTLKRVCISLIESIIVIIIVKGLSLTVKVNYISFILNSIIVSIITIVIILLFGFVFYKKDIKLLLIKIKNVKNK